jgi:hypothetical protein
MGETCLLSPTLVVPGGREVHWASFDVTAPPAAAPPTPPPATTKPATGGKGKSAAPTFSAAKAIAGKRAFTVQLKLRQAATVRITVTPKGAKKPLGSVTYKAKAGNFSRTVKAIGGKRLRPGRYLVGIKAGATTKTLTVRVAAA